MKTLLKGSMTANGSDIILQWGLQMNVAQQFWFALIHQMLHQLSIECHCPLVFFQNASLNDGSYYGSRGQLARKDPTRHSLPSCPGVAPAQHHPRWQSSRSLEMGPQLQLSPLAQPRRGLFNKLSYRGRCVPTPSQEVLRYREETFVNDAIVTERRRTKYRDIIPPYSGILDHNCWTYFERPDVRRLLTVTKPEDMADSAAWPHTQTRSWPAYGAEPIIPSPYRQNHTGT